MTFQAPLSVLSKFESEGLFMVRKYSNWTCYLTGHSVAVCPGSWLMLHTHAADTHASLILSFHFPRSASFLSFPFSSHGHRLNANCGRTQSSVTASQFPFDSNQPTANHCPRIFVLVPFYEDCYCYYIAVIICVFFSFLFLFWSWRSRFFPE